MKKAAQQGVIFLAGSAGGAVNLRGQSSEAGRYWLPGRWVSCPLREFSGRSSFCCGFEHQLGPTVDDDANGFEVNEKLCLPLYACPTTTD
jgi:hypothetical protein